MMNRTLIFVAALMVSGLVTADAEGQAWRDRIGLTDLETEFPGLEDGSGVFFGQIEAPTNSAGTAYIPNPANPQMTGKTITDVTGVGITSGHAHGVASRLCGNTGGVAMGVADIFCYEVNDYINVQLNFGGGDPFGDVFDVENHSWIANGLTTAQATQLLQRSDWRVDETNVNIFVGCSNSGGATTPQLMVPAYNVISVGRTDGSHSKTDTSFYGAGRQKPEIVNYDGPTSTSTPTVAGCAAILREATSGTDGENNEVIKALLLGGATKEEFGTDWSRTTTRPIDDAFGFGEVNILNSYHMMLAGEHDGSASTGAAPVALRGWDYGESINPSGQLYYEFEFPDGGANLSVALVWNALITDTNPGSLFSPVQSVANFAMELTDSSGAVVDSSDSPVNNLEHIWIESLPAGTYTLKITSDTNRDFGLAWRAEPGPLHPVAAFDVINGTYRSGGITELTASDNSDLTVSRNTLDIQSRVTVEFETSTSITNPTSLDLTFESSVFSRGVVVQNLDLFNFDTGVWDQIDTQNAARFGDITVTASPGASFESYVEPGTGKLEARVRYVSPSARQQFSANIDNVFWSIQ